MKFLLAFLLPVAFYFQVRGQDTLHFAVRADENGFMCPFLTPMFLQKMRDLGATDVRKDQDLTIYLSAPPASGLHAERILSILEGIGYQRSILHIETIAE